MSIFDEEYEVLNYDENNNEGAALKTKEEIAFEIYVKNFGTDRLIKRLINKRCIKPCGKECWEYGKIIARTTNHQSFKNFKELMDDRDFLIEIARITPNPLNVENYFFNYIHPKIKCDKSFKYEFLKQIYLNEDVYTLKDLMIIVEAYGLTRQNYRILRNPEMKQEIKNRLKRIGCDNYEKIYKEDKSQIKFFGRLQKDINKRNLMRDGLKDILETFECVEENTLQD